MISEFFIDRPIFANVIAIVTIILGLVCLFTLPVAQYPEIVPPTIQVTTLYPGASAEIIANTVGVPIEQAVNGVEGSIYMSSTSSSSGNYTLTVTFAVGTNLNAALTLVQNMVNGATAQLPEAVGAQGVTVRKVSTNILQVISIYSDDGRYDATYLSNYAIINLQYPLGRLPGVGQIMVFGAGPYSMRVWLDPNKLKYYNLTTLDVVNAIQQQNVQVVAGRLGAPPVPPDQTFQFTVNALGRLADVKQFQEIIVKSERSDQGETAQLVRVQDIARVELDQQFYSNFGGLSGKHSAQILVFALPGANAIDLGAKVKTAMAEMSQTFPEGLKYGIYYDTTAFIGQAIHSVYETLIEAGILVLIVIMVFLQNWRAMLVPATTVPVTIIGAFAAMALLGFTVNLMTLFALILAIGIVVDDAIVIVENASVYIEKGFHPREAAIKAMQELTGPVIGITLVLTAVFLPAAFMPGINGQLFRQFALVIASTAIISALNALTLKPAQCALWLRPHVQKTPNLFYRGFNKGYGVVERAYVVLIQWMVARTTLMVLVFIGVIALAGWRFTQQPTGFLPSEDQGFCVVVARLPDGAAQPRVIGTSNAIDAILKRSQGVEAWVTVGGYSFLDSTNVSNIMSTFVIYQDWSKRGAKLSQEHIVGTMQREFFAIQDAQVVVLVPPPIMGLGTSSGFQMMVEDRSSLGLGELEKAATEVMRAASGQSGLGFMATTFSARSPQLYLDIDRTKAESLNIPLNNVFDTLQAYLGSTYVNLFNKFNQVFQVYVQADTGFRLQPEDIKSLYVRNLKKEMVPLGTLLKVNRTLGSELVTRYNLYPPRPPYSGWRPRASAQERPSKSMAQVANHTLPRGTSYDWTATSYQEKQVGNQAYFIYALSITLVFLVLAAQYENWFNPAAVILVVPIAMVGVLLGLMVRNFDNNIYTQVGLVLMIALASKNAILVVEFARELREGGMSITEAAVEATRRRFRPIVMTSSPSSSGWCPW